MRFPVPQFIDVEDKIFGPLTFKQGVYLIGATGAAYITYALFGLLGVILIGLPLFGVAALFAFARPNNRPFVSTVSAAFFYALEHKLYLWKKTPQKKINIQPSASPQAPVTQHVSPKLTPSRLRALAFALDTTEEQHDQ